MNEQTFDELSIEAWRTSLSAERAHQAARLIRTLGMLHPGSLVIDFGCGTGQIAVALAGEGMRVLGIDRSPVAIAEAKQVSHPLCTFLEADWREYDPMASADCALFWFTTLCSGRESDVHALSIARRSLNSDGVLLLETRHWDRMVRRFHAHSERRGGSIVLKEHHSYDPVTGFQSTQEFYSTGDATIQRQYQTRRYSFPELSDMCFLAGFQAVEGFDEAGNHLSNDSERLVLRARVGRARA